MVVLKMILKRVAVSLFLLLIASFFVYSGVRASVDPSERIRNTKSPEAVQEFKERRHLDEPIVSQYKRWLGNAVTGDLGVGDQDSQDVVEKLSAGLSKSFELLVWGVLFAGIFGITAGVISAIYRNRAIDYSIQGISSLGIAIPVFWFAYVLIELFTILIPRWTGTEAIFYINGSPDGFFGQTSTGLWTLESITEYMRHLAMPIIVLTIQLAASWSRYQRASMVEALQSDFNRTAIAKGMSKKRVYWKHAFRNAELPMVNVVALDIGALFGGLVITEEIFGIQGMGNIFVESLRAGDATTLVSWTMLSAIAIIGFNLIADIIIPIVDPRART